MPNRRTSKVLRDLHEVKQTLDRANASLRGAYAQAIPGWGYTWKTLRLCCGGCQDGYLVRRQRRDRRYWIAGCSTYRETGCNFTLNDTEFQTIKGNVVLTLLLEQEPSWPFIRVEPRRRARVTT